MSRNNNAYWRAKNLPTVKEFCEDNDLEYKFMDGDWHIRIEGVLDVYPTRKRFFWLPTKEWGNYEDYDDLGRIFTERINDGR